MGKYKNIEVFYDNEKVGESFNNPKDLMKSVLVNTLDGHTIGLQFFQSKLRSSNSSLEVKWDGNTLPSSSTQDNLKVKDATGCVGVLVILGFLLGFLFLANSHSAGLSSLGIAVVYLILLMFIRKGSGAALTIFTVLYGLGSLYFLYTLMNSAFRSNVLGLLNGIALRIFALVILINGIQALVRLKNKQKNV